jgi:hypothetical protein
MITFAIIGLTFILKYGEILYSVRQFLCNNSRYFTKLFDCALCLGFWSGLVIGMMTGENLYIMPFFGAAVSFFADVVLELLQTAIIKLEK